MASFAILAHGARGAGTTTGTYVIPKDVTIYFFEADGQLMHIDAAKLYLNKLLQSPPDEAAVRQRAVEVKTEYQTIPNYEASGDDSMAAVVGHASGVYMIGVPPAGANATFFGYHNGTRVHISDIVGGSASRPGILGVVIYWLCCRAAPTGANAVVPNPVTIVTDDMGAPMIQAADREKLSTGMKPSEVVAAGGKWQ